MTKSEKRRLRRQHQTAYAIRMADVNMRVTDLNMNRDAYSAFRDGGGGVKHGQSYDHEDLQNLNLGSKSDGIEGEVSFRAFTR